jgi:hypothetical protein
MTSLNMGRELVCLPHDPKAILNSKLDEFFLSAKVNLAVKTERKMQKRRWLFMDYILNENVLRTQ